MFDVIDTTKCRNLVLSRFSAVREAASSGRISDPSGAKVSRVTLEEAFGLARGVISEAVVFDPASVPRYVAQFPAILEAAPTGSTISESLSQALLEAVFVALREDVTGAVAAQFSGYDADDVAAAVCTGLTMFDRHLKDDPFAKLRIRPEKVLAHLAAMVGSQDGVTIKNIMGQIGYLISELKTRSPDARSAARTLREANEYLGLIEAGFLRSQRVVAPYNEFAMVG